MNGWPLNGCDYHFSLFNEQNPRNKNKWKPLYKSLPNIEREVLALNQLISPNCQTHKSTPMPQMATFITQKYNWSLTEKVLTTHSETERNTSLDISMCWLFAWSVKISEIANKWRPSKPYDQTHIVLDKSVVYQTNRKRTWFVKWLKGENKNSTYRCFVGAMIFLARRNCTGWSWWCWHVTRWHLSQFVYEFVWCFIFCLL